MQAPLRTSLIGVLLTLGLPAVAHADSFVLAPLQGRNGAACTNVTDLLSAELDFQPAVSEVIQGKTAPSGNACLASTSCLSALTEQGGGQELITGVLYTTSKTYTMDMVYFDGHTIVRRQKFELAADPTALADGMTGVVRALLLGKTPAEEDKAQPAASDFDFSPSGNDDFQFEDGSTGSTKIASDDAARKRAEAEARAQAEAAARQKAQEEAQRRAAAEARRRQEEARRAEEERRRHEEEVAQQKAAASHKDPSPADFDPNSISFASASKSDIKIESNDAQGGSDAVASLDDLDDLDLDDPSPRHSASSSRSGSDDLDLDLDGPVKQKKPKRQRSPSASHATARTPRPASESNHAVSLVARGGYSPYYTLGFLTYGGEISVPFGQSGLYASAGVEAWSVHRVLPQAVAEQVGQARAWDSIFPFNAGLLYKFDHGGDVVPYVGADLLAAQYYVDKSAGKSYWAFGPRARLGADVFLSKVFGLTVDGSLGFWSGKQWEIIDTGVKNSGMLPRIEGGAVFRL